ncbi:putative protein YjbR [Neolewinella maritima]|uniref:MmcQ/YjbR family DNA-binding protein n=1 Tax=Neolewinella maritima TaxID=1383882 RepID=A0ABN8F615_9BACT|nr:MmcQ/YjbR family DNA-binding protein [Neolewinella maritima]CAH0999570.1 putative protein YjbR [Neolewinella maritima]
MDLYALRNYCLAKSAVTEELPFGPETLAFKVGGKLFALTGLEQPDLSVNLKCDPERAQQLRERYPDTIIPGYHMNKRHWNTVYLHDGILSDQQLEELIDHSYALVVAGMSRKVRELHGL